MALENVLVDTFLPQGNDWANPALDQQANMLKKKLILIFFLIIKNPKITLFHKI